MAHWGIRILFPGFNGAHSIDVLRYQAGNRAKQGAFGEPVHG